MTEGGVGRRTGERTRAPMPGPPERWAALLDTVLWTAPVGIAVFDDPRNKYRACWHSREYGLMAANPFGRTAAGFPDAKGQADLVKMAKGDHLKLRYGIFLHLGDVKEGKVAEYYDRFAALKKSEG